MTLIYDEMCEESGKNISTCVIQTIAGLAAIQAKTFIDSTGDAYLARNIGVPFERGYENNVTSLKNLWRAA